MSDAAPVTEPIEKDPIQEFVEQHRPDILEYTCIVPTSYREITDVIEEIRLIPRKFTKLIVSGVHEYNMYEFFDIIHTWCTNHRHLDISDAHFIGGASNTFEEYINWCNYNNIAPEIGAHGLDYWLMVSKDGLHNESLSESEAKQSVTRSKKYLHLNRMPRSHRMLSVSMLASENILDQGMVSLGQGSLGDIDQDTSTAPLSDERREEIQKLANDWFHEITNTLKLSDDQKTKIDYGWGRVHPNLPLLVDTDTLRFNLAHTVAPELYTDTWFSVVSETMCLREYHSVEADYNYNINPVDDANAPIFFSEKIFKPIMNLHPFILISTPKSLARLHELGFKTFYPFINEEYDQELDDYKRLEMIVAEVKRLCELSNDELRDWYMGMMDILTHNKLNLQKEITHQENRLLNMLTAIA